MNEKELAAALQATKDDPAEWGEPSEAEAPTKTKRLAAMVSVRLTPEELAQIQQRAQADGQTVSSYLRSLAVRDVQSGVMPPNFGVSINVGGTYSSGGSQWLVAHGRRLATTIGQPTSAG